MSREVVCPFCGCAVSIDTQDPPLDDAPADARHTVESIIPKTHSGDDPLNFGVGGNGFPSPSVCDEATLPSVPIVSAAPRVTIDGAFPGSAPDGTSGPFFGESDLLSSPDPDRTPTVAILDMPARVAAMSPPRAPETGPELEMRSRPTSWQWALLTSYASAVTLACLWLLWRQPRSDRPSPDRPRSVASDEPVRTGPAGVRPARAVTAPAPLSDDLIIALGTSLTIGSLEFTPIAVQRGPVVLEHVGLGAERPVRDGGADALFLRARFRNRSTDAVFAPLDESLVREPDDGLAGSFLETAEGSRIYAYPLPVQSDWSIAGQTFSALRPGESFETVVVSDQGAANRIGSESIWRVKLRTGIGANDFHEVGVRFSPRELQ